MLMSWSNWFSEIIWPTIAVESTGAVGSWFCNSCARRFRNVVSNPPLELLLEVEVPVLVAVAVPAGLFTAFATPLFATGLSVFKIVGIV
jgi:hypothetical protein